MAAPFRNMSYLGNICKFMSYSRLSHLLFHQKRCLQKALEIPEVKYIKDKEGNLVSPGSNRFPSDLDIDPAVAAEYDKDPMRYPKNHKGLMTFRKTPMLPKRLEKNARLVLAENELISSKSFQSDIKHLQEVYLRRQPPIDKQFQKAQIQTLTEKILEEEIKSKEIDFESLNDTEWSRLLDRVSNIARSIYKKSNQAWHEIEYKNYSGLVFLAARLASNYTVLLKIFDEINRRDSNFVPGSVLNVGSGVGSAVWAGNTIWEEKVNEYYNVDISGYMNDLARKLMARDIKDPLNCSIPGVHFRQYIPSPEHAYNRFPLVVSAYLLMEQPSFEERLNLISLLWELTEDYLVLVEHGTTAGYRLLMEAKEIIFQIGKEHSDQTGYVFAPCTHDKLCPKLKLHKSPCTYLIEYRKLNVGIDKGQGDDLRKERYSYMVFRKGEKTEGKRYSRVTHTVVKSNHVYCHMCCPDGSLRNFVLTRKHQSSALYRCAKRCTEGDFLPFEWPETITESSNEMDIETKEKQSERLSEKSDNSTIGTQDENL